MSFRFSTLVDPFLHARTPIPPQTGRFLAETVRPLRLVIILSLVLTVAGALLEVWLIGYAGRLVDVLGATAPADLWTVHGLELSVAATLVLCVRPLADAVREALDDIAFRPNAETMLLHRAHGHILRQSVGWFRQRLSGYVATQVQGAATGATGAIYSVIHTLVYVAVYVAGSFWLMASMDPRLVLPLAGWLGLYLLLMAYVIPRYRRASAGFQEAASAFTGSLVDTYANIDTIKLFGDLDAEDADGRERLERRRQAFIAVQRIEVTINASMVLLSSLLMVGLIGYAIVLWQGGAAPLGLVAAAVALSFRITAMAEWLLDALSNLFGSLGTLRQALRTIAQPIGVTDRPGAPPLAVRAGAVRFRGVTHHYGHGRGGLDNLSLDIAAGQKVGLVGRSGAGKSTLVNLLLRFHDAEAGRIEIDGQDIADVAQDSLRRQIGMVTQDVSLLHRSIRDNLAYGRGGVEDDAIRAAARAAQADRFIDGLRDGAGNAGYDAIVGERGVTLSGGQRQRIALARAILKDAPILVLDEATSALDSEVEAAIRDTLDRLMEGRTVIAIAHRLSTIARMDRIVVLDAGRVAEDGTHAELLSLGGIYASLWAHQADGFIGADSA